MKWINYNQVLPQRWAFKKDIPPVFKRHWAKRVRFNFENAWIVRDENGCVMMPDGSWACAFDFYLISAGHVIGLRDVATANAHPWAEEWREAMTERINDRLSVQP